MSEYTVLAEISCAKISKELSLEKACLFGCGVSTGNFSEMASFSCISLNHSDMFTFSPYY